MGIDINRIEDLELLLGITSLRSTLDKVIESIWIPFWKNLPLHIRTPSTLLHNKEIIFSMLESVGSHLVSEHVALYQENKDLRSESIVIRKDMLTTYASLVPFAQSCQVYDFTNPAPSPENSDEYQPFSDDEISGLCDTNDESFVLLTPYWSLQMTFSHGPDIHTIDLYLSHQEYVMYFADKAEVIYKPFYSPPNPEFDPFNEQDDQ